MTSTHPILLAAVLAASLVAAGCGDDAQSCDPTCASTGGGGQGGSGGGGGGGTTLSPAESYCDCVLFTCHDAYHEHYGPETDEPAARAACLAEAETLPVAGMDVDMGNFVECRLHYCAMGVEQPDVCAATIGEGACAP